MFLHETLKDYPVNAIFRTLKISSVVSGSIEDSAIAATLIDAPTALKISITHPCSNPDGC